MIKKRSIILLVVTLFISIQSYSSQLQLQSLYDTLVKYEVDQPQISLMIIVYETGWLKCKDCAFDDNNLFGFKTKNGFLKFEDHASCIKYYKRWQTKYWLPYRSRNPNGNYYHFLKWIGYCNDMDTYISNLEIIKKMLISRNLIK